MPKKPSRKRYAVAKAGRPATVHERVASYRKRMRAKGYKPVETWVPDTSNPKFIADFRRQARAIARVEKHDKKLMDWLDANTADLVAQIEAAERGAGVPAPSWDPSAERPV